MLSAMKVNLDDPQQGVVLSLPSAEELPFVPPTSYDTMVFRKSPISGKREPCAISLGISEETLVHLQVFIGIVLFTQRNLF